MTTFITPIRLRSLTGEGTRKVTWLELFFDLIFVAAVAQVAEPLRDDYTTAGLVRLVPLFLLIWLAWTGHTTYATRFDTDDVLQRVLTLAQVFAVAAMAANARDALDSRSSAGFAAAYAAVRLVLVAQYARARRVHGAGPLATRFLIGHGIAAVIWLASALMPFSERLVAWAIAFSIDLATPWFTVSHTVAAPPDAAHLPERFGLFTLILLGESVVAVMHGMESQEEWPVAAALAAFLGMTSQFLVWSWYFDAVNAPAEQHVRTRRDAVRFHIWTYAHFPLSLGIVMMGVGIQHIVTVASRATLEPGETLLLTGGAALVMGAMSAIASTTSRRKPAAAPASAAAGIAAAVALLGATVPPLPSLLVVASLAAVLFAQLVMIGFTPSSSSREQLRRSA
jgi:low temperature requirement protein LtrA